MSLQLHRASDGRQHGRVLRSHRQGSHPRRARSTRCVLVISSLLKYQFLTCVLLFSAIVRTVRPSARPAAHASHTRRVRQDAPALVLRHHARHLQRWQGPPAREHHRKQDVDRDDDKPRVGPVVDVGLAPGVRVPGAHAGPPQERKYEPRLVREEWGRPRLDEHGHFVRVRHRRRGRHGGSHNLPRQHRLCVLSFLLSQNLR